MPGTNQTRCQPQQDDSPQGLAVFTPPRVELSTELREIPQVPVEAAHEEARMARGEPCTTVWLYEPGKGPLTDGIIAEHSRIERWPRTSNRS